MSRTSAETVSSRTKTKESKESVENVELIRNPTPKKTSLISAYFPESKFEHLDDVLQHYGAWRPFYLCTHVNVLLAVCICFMAHTLAGRLLLELTQTSLDTSFCACGILSYSLNKEDNPDKKLFDVDDNSIASTIQWGFYLAHLTLFLSHLFGRRCIYIASLISNAIMCIIIGVFHDSGDLSKFAFMALHYGIHHMRVNILVNSIEWMPSQGRLVTVCVVYFGSIMGRMTIVTFVFFQMNYSMLYSVGIVLLVFILPMAYFCLHDSPYHLLSINDIYGLQFCFEILESWIPGCSPMPAEEIVDDVAFSVYERHETFVDTLWASIRNWRIFKEFIIFTVLILALVSMQFSSENRPTLYFNYNVDILSHRLIKDFIELAAIPLTYMITGKRRGLALIWTLLIFIISTSIIQVLPVNAIDFCTAKFGREGFRGVFYQICFAFRQMARSAFEMILNLHLLESFPTTIRPHVYGVLFTFKIGFLDSKIVELLEKIMYYIPQLPDCGVFSFCFIALVVLIVNEMGAHRPMRTYFADLKESKKQNGGNYCVSSIPLISTAVKKIN